MVKKPNKTEKFNAKIVKADNNFEVRCANCGKLLFKYIEKTIDRRNKSVIIVSRCTRNDCGVDNIISI